MLQISKKSWHYRVYREFGGKDDPSNSFRYCLAVIFWTLYCAGLIAALAFLFLASPVCWLIEGMVWFPVSFTAPVAEVIIPYGVPNSGVAWVVFNSQGVWASSLLICVFCLFFVMVKALKDAIWLTLVNGWE